MSNELWKYDKTVFLDFAKSVCRTQNCDWKRASKMSQFTD